MEVHGADKNPLSVFIFSHIAHSWYHEQHLLDVVVYIQWRWLMKYIGFILFWFFFLSEGLWLKGLKGYEAPMGGGVPPDPIANIPLKSQPKKKKKKNPNPDIVDLHDQDPAPPHAHPPLTPPPPSPLSPPLLLKYMVCCNTAFPLHLSPISRGSHSYLPFKQCRMLLCIVACLSHLGERRNNKGETAWSRIEQITFCFLFFFFAVREADCRNLEDLRRVCSHGKKRL